MKAIILNNFGSPEDLIFQEVTNPKASGEQVLVKIHAAGVNALDIGKASGAFKKQFELRFPWIPGIDFAGVVDFAGDQVKGFKAGDEVYGESMEGGAFAEYIAVDPRLISLKPQTLNFTEAASVPVSADTAWNILFQNNLNLTGKTVLIHGAAGAVGSYAVQFAHQAGAKVIANAAAKDEEFLTSLGADEFINREDPFETIVSDIDIVIDLVGKDVQQRSYQVIKEGGTMISTNQPPSKEMADKYNIHAVLLQYQPSGPSLSRISDLVDSAKLKINLSDVYSLQEAATAWNDLLGKSKDKPKKKNGRIVLEVE